MIYCVVYPTHGHGKETDPYYGFLLLGQWPPELSVTQPTCAQKNTHTSQCVHAATMTDLQADHGVDTQQGCLQQHVVLVWPGKALKPKQPIFWLSSSISFRPVSMLVSAIFLLCQSEVFHQSVCPRDRTSSVPCFNSSSQRCCKVPLCGGLPPLVSSTSVDT